MNGVPASAGASLVPDRSCRWQGAQLASKAWWPLATCVWVKGPLAPWPKAVALRAPSAIAAPKSRMVLLRIFGVLSASCVELGNEPVVLLRYVRAHRFMSGEQPAPQIAFGSPGINLRRFLAIDLNIELAGAQRRGLCAGQLEIAGDGAAGGFGDIQVKDRFARHTANGADEDMGLGGVGQQTVE